MRSLRQLSTLFVAVALFAVPPAAAFAAPAATPSPASAPAQGPAADPTVPAAPADDEQYAAREAKDKSAAEFEGGDATLYIGGGAVTVLLIVLILVIVL